MGFSDTGSAKTKGVLEKRQGHNNKLGRSKAESSQACWKMKAAPQGSEAKGAKVVLGN